MAVMLFGAKQHPAAHESEKGEKFSFTLICEIADGGRFLLSPRVEGAEKILFNSLGEWCLPPAPWRHTFIKWYPTSAARNRVFQARFSPFTASLMLVKKYSLKVNFFVTKCALAVDRCPLYVIVL